MLVNVTIDMILACNKYAIWQKWLVQEMFSVNIKL